MAPFDYNLVLGNADPTQAALEALLQKYGQEAPEEEDTDYLDTLLGGVSKVLAPLTWPERALWGGIKGITEGRSPLSGAWESLAEKPVYAPDVLGIGEATPEMDWPEWTGRHVARLLTSVAGDPLTYAFLPLKGPGLLGRLGAALGVKEGRSLGSHLIMSKLGGEALAGKLAGGPLGKLFMERLPNITHEGIDLGQLQRGIDRILIEGGPYDVRKVAGETSKAYDSALQELMAGGEKITAKDVIDAIEVPGSRPELASAVEALKPLRDLQRASHTEWGDVLERMGYARPAKIEQEEWGYFPRVATAEARRAARKAGIPFTDPQAFQQASREVFRWVDDKGTVRAVGSLSDPRTGVRKSGEGYFFVGPNHKGNTIPERAPVVNRLQATFKDVTSPPPQVPGATYSVMPPESWVSNPIAAYAKNTMATRAKETYAKLLEELQRLGAVRKIEEEGLLPRHVKLLVPGFENLQATKPVANYLNNLGKQMYSAATPVGAVERAMEGLINNRLGDLANEETRWWRRNVLASPGWLTGNVGSDIGQAYLGGQSPLTIPLRLVQGIITKLGRGGNAIPGLTNKRLAEELTRRGLFTDTLYGSALREAGDVAAHGPLWTKLLGPQREGVMTGRRLGEMGAPRLLQGAGQGLADLLGGINERFLQAGQHTEEAFRAGAAIDWLKKNARDFASQPKEVQANLLDQAAEHARQTIVGGSERFTPFEKNLSALIPFWGWMRGIGSRYGRMLLNEPQRGARMARAQDELLTPLDPEDRAIADEWIKESMPITGAFGKSFGLSPEGYDRMMLLSRYHPFGTIEALQNRPIDTLLSAINPAPKAGAEILTNWNTFKRRELDPLAGRFPANILNPLLGTVQATSDTGPLRPYSLGSQQWFGQNIPAVAEYLLSASPPGRHVREIEELGRAAGLWPQAYKAETTPMETTTWYVSGGKIYPWNPDKARMRRQNEKKRALQDVKSALKYARRVGDDDAIEHYERIRLGLQFGFDLE